MAKRLSKRQIAQMTKEELEKRHAQILAEIKQELKAEKQIYQAEERKEREKKRKRINHAKYLAIGELIKTDPEYVVKKVTAILPTATERNKADLNLLLDFIKENQAKETTFEN